MSGISILLLLPHVFVFGPFVAHALNRAIFEYCKKQINLAAIKFNVFKVLSALIILAF